MKKKTQRTTTDGATEIARCLRNAQTACTRAIKLAAKADAGDTRVIDELIGVLERITSAQRVISTPREVKRATPRDTTTRDIATPATTLT